MFTFMLTSTSPLKKNAITTCLSEYLPKTLLFFNYQLLDASCNNVKYRHLINRPSQPFDVERGEAAAKLRLNEVIGNYDIKISVENYIETSENSEDDNRYLDRCCVVIKIDNHVFVQHSDKPVRIPSEFVEKSIQSFGDKTAGEFINEKHPEIPANDWILDIYDRYFPDLEKPYANRREQIIETCTSLLDRIFLNFEGLKSFIKEIPDFPKSGIIFKDINPIYANSFMNKILFCSLLKLIPDTLLSEVKYFVGIEARGFSLAAGLALLSGKGFIMIRKVGKLPGRIFTQEYKTEYGADTLTIQKNSLQNGDIVVICDDVVATGGTMMAAIKLCEKCGGITKMLLGVQHIASLSNEVKLNLGEEYEKLRLLIN